MNITTQQLEKKFKHAGDFGVIGTATQANLEAFDAALRKHVANGDTVHIQGWYRGQEVFLHVDSGTALAVITDKMANFVSGWRLSTQQLEYVLREGKLGGG
ncbi:MAG TPA: colicin D domain-containing protein [Pirellulales bacterium]